MCPCRNCLTLALCKTSDLHKLVDKCVLLRKYLGVIKVKPIKVFPDGSERGHKIFSNLSVPVHLFRIATIKKYINHTFKP